MNRDVEEHEEEDVCLFVCLMVAGRRVGLNP